VSRHNSGSAVCIKNHIHSGKQTPDDAGGFALRSAIMLTVPELSVLIALSWQVVGLCHHSMAHPEFVEEKNCL